jgi:PPOX class probable F420-dependent enzyme
MIRAKTIFLHGATFPLRNNKVMDPSSYVECYLQAYQATRLFRATSAGALSRRPQSLLNSSKVIILNKGRAKRKLTRHPRRRAAFYNAAAIQSEVLMSQVIPEKYRDLFQKRAFASLGTLMPDGRPQVTPVWCDFDGEHVIFNSAKGRQKDRNVRRDPRVSLAIIDPENPYRYLEIRGRVVEITEDGADENINKLAKKYLGVDKYPYAQPSEVRVLYKIKPEHTTVMG